MTDDENQFVAAAAAHAPELIVKEGEDLDYPVLYIYIYIYIYILYLCMCIYIHTHNMHMHLCIRRCPFFFGGGMVVGLGFILVTPDT
jgi:hypothetical protein